MAKQAIVIIRIEPILGKGIDNATNNIDSNIDTHNLRTSRVPVIVMIIARRRVIIMITTALITILTAW